MEPYFYNVNVTWSKDRKGIMCSPELKPGSEMTGGLRPTTEGLSPTTEGLSPTTEGLSPTTGGLSPTTGGLSPTTGGLSPTTGGCIEVATPPEFPKGIPGIWSPEHLFTASVSSCLMTTFLAIAENSGLDFVSFCCGSRGKLEKVDGKFLMTEVLLEPVVVIKEEKDTDRAIRILQKAEVNCLISNSVNTKIVMKPVVEVEAVNV